MNCYYKLLLHPCAFLYFKSCLLFYLEIGLRTRVHSSGIESCAFFFSCELLLVNHCISVFISRNLFAVLFGDWLLRHSTISHLLIESLKSSKFFSSGLVHLRDVPIILCRREINSRKTCWGTYCMSPSLFCISILATEPFSFSLTVRTHLLHIF